MWRVGERGGGEGRGKERKRGEDVAKRRRGRGYIQRPEGEKR